MRSILGFLEVEPGPLGWPVWAVSRLLETTLFNPFNRLFGLYLLAAVALAAVSFTLYRREGFRPLNFLGFCFPRAVYLHASAILDYQIYVVNRVLSRAVSMAAVIGTVGVAAVTSEQLGMLFGHRDPLIGSALWASVAYTLAVLLVSDFARYLNHAAHHFIPVLWPFHSLHHSAEVLTPLTLYRKHPVYQVVSKSVVGMISGLVQGLLIHFLYGKAELVTLVGVNAGVALFHFAGSNLRHSHIWLSFGPVLSHVFMSPAQHQIHHSAALEHRDKNMGQIFAFWDWMFGTLYVPKQRIALVFGIGDGRPQPHPNLLRAYAVPFAESWAAVRSRRSQIH